MALPATVIDTLHAQLERDPNVVGYSRDQLAAPGATAPEGVRIYVERLGQGDLPREIEGLPVHLVEAGRPENHRPATAVNANPRTTVRPVLGGISISGPETGTLGYFVDRKGKRCALSAGHVLNGNATVVLQRGADDGGTNKDAIGKVVVSVYAASEGIDAAAAELDSGTAVTLELNQLGAVRGTAQPVLNGKVKKSGRTTGVTSGTIIDTNATITFNGNEIWHGMVAVQGAGSPFSDGGDSGSLVVTDDTSHDAIALLKGGSPKMTYCCRLDAVLKRLDATFAQ